MMYSCGETSLLWPSIEVLIEYLPIPTDEGTAHNARLDAAKSTSAGKVPKKTEKLSSEENPLP
jgi:hypothetical protein